MFFRTYISTLKNIIGVSFNILYIFKIACVCKRINVDDAVSGIFFYKQPYHM